ncbi:MAG: M48 family metalloprotease [Alphaproteobacteria bacterium]
MNNAMIVAEEPVSEHIGAKTGRTATVREPRFPRWSAFRTRLQALIGTLLVLLLLVPAQAGAQSGFKVIRDVEIETYLNDITNPILDAAGISRGTVNLYIVQDKTLNAFVAGGLNLFINTGLLTRAEHPGQLAGVIAHEVGHIAGGHLSRVGGAQQRAVGEVILSTVLGAAAAVAGAPALGTAIIAGGQTVAQHDILRFSRGQEQAADQAGVSYLRQVGVSAAGLAEFFHILDEHSLLSATTENPFLRSHPLTRDRIRFVEAQVQPPKDGGPGYPSEWAIRHERMVAKLEAFLDDPRRVLQKATSDSLTDRYRRAIALYRLPDLENAVAEIDALIADHPDDPYFRELKGQMLFENGRVEAAIAPYREAVRLKPVPLLQIGLARALIESGSGDAGREAIDLLKAAVSGEPGNAGAWRLLGIAQGQAGEEGDASLSLAEWALLSGKADDARLHAKRAEARIKPNDPGWLQLQDILRAIEEI